MKVQIKTPSDDIELDVEPHWTIKWIKAILVEKTNEPVALQHLFFDGLTIFTCFNNPFQAKNLKITWKFKAVDYIHLM
jgi:hypothetical protein